ncbi:hypothetical protein FU871_06045 [Campylobacter jejuni]|uniref:YopX family protein n=1 Tax=Campylobacter jejuni TaxID=197 RepID=UPI0017ABA940|nr:YopX family protein [Campylobacter jejuni]EAH8350231.1 hypothetical protein [Campylobacter jejuni]EAJ6551064.1 hypothetical protein [Campylobacter jejuni]ECP9201524.1 hypothetical protein [Campylobacter jejuni]EEK2490066.1 hypothetical protein [Campylobacter jejuni]EHU8448328.1 hypothetical protein [Campylobacter jejuni]
MKLQDFDFRIWDKNYTGCDNKNCKCQSNFIYGEEAKIRLSEFNNDAEIELWTGYFDKNDKKIYEGDILENKMTMEDLPYKVVFKWGAFYLVEIDENDEDLMDEFLFTELEVIGNIHENPELLKC